VKSKSNLLCAPKFCPTSSHCATNELFQLKSHMLCCPSRTYFVSPTWVHVCAIQLQPISYSQVLSKRNLLFRAIRPDRYLPALHQPQRRSIPISIQVQDAVLCAQLVPQRVPSQVLFQSCESKLCPSATTCRRLCSFLKCQALHDPQRRSTISPIQVQAAVLCSQLVPQRRSIPVSVPACASKLCPSATPGRRLCTFLKRQALHESQQCFPIQVQAPVLCAQIVSKCHSRLQALLFFEAPRPARSPSTLSYSSPSCCFVCPNCVQVSLQATGSALFIAPCVFCLFKSAISPPARRLGTRRYLANNEGYYRRVRQCSHENPLVTPQPTCGIRSSGPSVAFPPVNIIRANARNNTRGYDIRTGDAYVSRGSASMYFLRPTDITGTGTPANTRRRTT
jgi:hypothetical protein